MRALGVVGSAIALGLAAIALQRWRRGRRVIAGRYATHAVRAAALLLFVLEGQADAGEPAPAAGSPDGLVRIGSPKVAGAGRSRTASFGGTLPAALAGEGLAAWARARGLAQARGAIRLLAALEAETDPGRRAAQTEKLRHGAAWLPEPFQEVMNAHLAGEPVELSRATGALDALEAGGFWEPALAGWLWRRAGGAEAEALAAFYARIETHLRAAETMTKAAALTGPVRYVPWMSKAAPPEGYRELRAPADLEATARRLYPETPAGTWEVDGVVSFAIRGATKPAVLRRRGEASEVKEGGFVRLRRLDVLEAKEAIVLEHGMLGDIPVPAGTVVTARRLPSLLPEAARASLAKEAKAAIAGDAAAIGRLEAVLPAAHAALREVMAADPRGAGAPAIRQLLTSFDE